MSKLIQLKKTVTIKEAANYLTKSWNEDVVESDILQFAFDRHLTLSVHFISPDKVQCTQKHAVDGVISTAFSYLEEREKKITITMNGLWDLLMIGNEKATVQSKIHDLTFGVKPLDEALKDFDKNKIGTFLKNEEGQIYKIYSKSDLNDNYYYGENVSTWSGLPHDSVYVIRTSELQKFVDQLSISEKNAENSFEKPLTASARTSLLIMIFGMAKQKYKFNPNLKRSSTSTDIKNDIELSGLDIDGETVKSYLDEASERFHKTFNTKN